MRDPNFPDGLDIQPLIIKDDEARTAFSVDTQEKAIALFGIAGRIWEAAQLMTRYFELSLSAPDRLDPPCSIFSTKKTELDSDSETDDCAPLIVELGSGTGYVGIKLAQSLAAQGCSRSSRVILTDLPEVCRLLEDNLNNERSSWPNSEAVHVDVLPLSWGDVRASLALSDAINLGGRNVEKRKYPTHIVCSDLVYFPHLLAPLLRSLLHLTSPPLSTPEHAAEILISYRIRSFSKETSFWSAFGLWFAFYPVLIRGDKSLEKPTEEADRAQSSTENYSWKIFRSDTDEGIVFIARRKPESYSWDIADDDKDLLAGVGACGTIASKSDDTFESLLLMHCNDPL